MQKRYSHFFMIAISGVLLLAATVGAALPEGLDPNFSPYPKEAPTGRVVFEDLKAPADRAVTAVQAKLPIGEEEGDEIELEVVTVGSCADQYLAFEDEISDSVSTLRFANVAPITGILRMPCERTMEYRWLPFLPYENFGAESPFENQRFTLRVGPSQNARDQFFEVQVTVSVDKTDSGNVKIRYSDLKTSSPSL